MKHQEYQSHGDHPKMSESSLLLSVSYGIVRDSSLRRQDTLHGDGKV